MSTEDDARGSQVTGLGLDIHLLTGLLVDGVSTIS